MVHELNNVSDYVVTTVDQKSVELKCVMNEIGWIMQSCEKLPCNETEIWIGAIASFPAFFGKNTDVAAG